MSVLTEPPSFDLPNCFLNERFRIGVVGLGRFFEWVHEPALRHLKAWGWPVDIVALCDPDASRREVFSTSWPEAVQYENFDAMCAAGGFDGICLFTPAPLTADFIRRLQKTGLPVFAEKPVAYDLEELGALSKESEEVGQRVLVAYNRTFMPNLENLREQLENNNESGYMRVLMQRLMREEPDFYGNTAVHPVSVLCSLFPKLEVVESRYIATPGHAAAQALSASLLGYLEDREVAIDFQVVPCAGLTSEAYVLYGKGVSHHLTYNDSILKSEGLSTLHRYHNHTIVPLHTYDSRDQSEGLRLHLGGFFNAYLAFFRLAQGLADTPLDANLAFAARVQSLLGNLAAPALRR